VAVTAIGVGPGRDQTIAQQAGSAAPWGPPTQTTARREE
jgi:hypothetical protein